MDLLTILFAIFSTLLAISTFVTGQIFQLRTVNLHKFHDHCLTFFSLHQQGQEEAEKIYAERISGYETNADNAWRAFWISLGGTAIFLLGWLASTICWLCQVWTCYALYPIILAVVGIGVLGLSVGSVLHFHREYLKENPGADDDIKKVLLEKYGIKLNN